MRTLALLLTAIALSACDSSDGPPDSFLPSPDPVLPPTESPNGIWKGKLTPTLGSADYDVHCLVNFVISCILIDTPLGTYAGGMNGPISMSANSLDASGDAFTTPAFSFQNGSRSAAFSATDLVVDERDTISGTLAMGGQNYGMLTSFSLLTDLDSSMAAVAGVYSTFALNGDPSTLSIQLNGTLFAQTQAGCVANGAVAVINPQNNGYVVSLTLSSCPGLDGVYDGVAMSDSITNDVFAFALFGGTGGLVGRAFK